MEQKRGQLTQQIKDRYKELTGDEITVKMLRLIPYIQYLIINKQGINLIKVSKEEIDIIKKWYSKGYILYYNEKEIKINKRFWLIMNEILWLGYVDLK